MVVKAFDIQEKVITLEKYFQLEEKSLHKNEFRNGKIIPMPGASINHNKITRNLTYFLTGLSYEKGDFEVHSPEQQVYLTELNTITYPDGCIVIGETEEYTKYAITNPTIIFEVASDSTYRYDRNGKFQKYQTIPSFQEYVLIDQDTPSVEVFFKTETGWVFEFYLGLVDTVKLQTINCELKMSDIYKNVKNLQSPQGLMDLEQEE